MRKHNKEHRLREAFPLMILLLAFFFLPFSLRAEETEVREITPNEVSMINDLLEKGISIKLMSGEIYDIRTIVARSNTSIDATGATIYCSGNILIGPCDFGGGDYSYRLKNFSVKGGSWKTYKENGENNVGFRLAFADNITFDGLTMDYCNYEAHSFEIIACSNVTIKNCRITPLGTPRKGSAEEQIQLDISSTDANAPSLPESLHNGATCHNVKILNNTVTGCRAVCTNFTKARYRGNCHTNIVVEGNKLYAKNAEALALFNTTTATIRNNICISYGKKSGSSFASDAYYSGCHIRLQGTVSTGDGYSNRKIIVSGNTFKGEQFGLRIGSADTKGFRSLKVSGNKMFAASGFTGAYRYDSILQPAISDSGNRRYKQSVAYFPGNSGALAAKMITSLKVKTPKKKVKAGKNLKMKVVYNPSGASMKKVLWKVSNSKYATISKTGTLKTKNAGKNKKITVWAIALDGSGKVSNKYKIKITKK